MAINPISFTEKVVGDFLRYQATTYSFADPQLDKQLRSLLSLEETRRSPLMKGPYISLSRAFKVGNKIDRLIDEGLLHPFMANLIPYESLWAHQEEAIRAIAARRPTLISTGTGSGKTECFLYPIISRCLELRDQGAEPGIVAVIVYPMNALAEDQLGRLRGLLAGTGITFGMYVGKTPDRRADVTGVRLRPGSSKADYEAALKKVQAEKRGVAVHPAEERVSREEMRTPGKQPRILLTNVKQLELLLTRHVDVELFDHARLEFLVFDEAHTYRGAMGAETACLIRRLQAFCGTPERGTVCIATSATLVDSRGESSEARKFASRFFGVPEDEAALVTEQYEEEPWAAERWVPQVLPGDAAVHLRNVLDSLDADDGGKLLRVTAQAVTGVRLREANWEEDLYDTLARSELCYQIAAILTKPQPLDYLVSELSSRLGRPVPEEEVLLWLALGVASSKNGRPLLRPVVHVFVRGVGGAVVTFPDASEEPRLWLSAEDKAGSVGDDNLFHLRVLTCTTCGQHYFEHWVKDISVTPGGVGGGDLIENRRFWPALDEEKGGQRVILFDRLVGTEDDQDEPSRAHEVYFCRYCGALHSESRDRCDSCGREGRMVKLYVVEQDERHPGRLTSCLSCRAIGRNVPGSYREPAKPVRAANVSDIHVLAQNMINELKDRRRLLVFADNRQEAAFQAGWMKDHARRFRLRALMMNKINEGPISIGDLVAHLDLLLDSDDDLSRHLIPEVWSAHPKRSEGKSHAEDRWLFLKIAVLREIATGVRQRIGLEPWGRIQISYRGLTADHPFIKEWANQLGIEPSRLCDGISALLDNYRRSAHVLDRQTMAFSRIWDYGSREVQRGYIPIIPGVPKGLKLRRDVEDNKSRVTQWLPPTGDSMAKQAARSWGVDPDHVDEFVAGLWKVFTEDLKILAPVTLLGSRGQALPRCSGTYQIDADLITIAPSAERGVWKCQKCRRVQTRPTPNNRCLSWRCDGELRLEPEDPHDYNLVMLDQDFAMVRPAEHSAQVPAQDRERLEILFKDEKSDSVNTLVCTPTLELGIDIGALDAVLMRNVPPLPSNYWQRVGRAGRRHRLAVNITYARSVDHDRAYFAEPSKLLEGRVEPPRFNLRNEVMVEKHVHAAVLTKLHSLARNGSGQSDEVRNEISDALRQVFPGRIRDYLFDESGNVRSSDFDVGPLRRQVERFETVLVEHLVDVFGRHWPDDSSDVVAEERLRAMIRSMPDRLDTVIKTLRKRLNWAMDLMRRLDADRQRKGTLDPDEDALYQRCDRLVKRLKGIALRSRSEAEGYDENNTYSVLAAEGFLPGYGLDTGSVIATALMPRNIMAGPDFVLPRPSAVALREYVPGNLIYANGHRFVARFFHLDPVPPLIFQVDVSKESVLEVGAAQPGAASTLGATSIKAIPVCDVDLTHVSHITDEEDYRFQLAVAVYGYETERHGVGKRYTWGNRREVKLMKSVHLRLVNVGAAAKVADGELGYPMSLVTGASRSPLASQAELEDFENSNLERYGKPTDRVGIYADVIADALCIPGLASRDEAYSVLEALRIGMTRVLEMELEDLHVLVVARGASDEVDGLLYDPMPGGSGLLEQACERWPEVVAAAEDVVKNCPGVCERACIDCLKAFRNAHYHKYLDRKIAAERLAEWGYTLEFRHEIPASLPKEKPSGEHQPTNQAEDRLRYLLERAGFPKGEWQKQIVLGPPLGTTTPDCYFPGEDEYFKGVCIYLDGLSVEIHGNPEIAERDRAIRTHLRNTGYEVIEIPVSHLEDREQMAVHFSRLANYLMGKERARELRTNKDWFE